jgi:dimethylaniline monooxygenase (N-oxide forming)
MRVCVIGAGPSGLVAIKELLEEGHEPCCYEKSGTVGGVFNPPPAGRSYDHLRLTVSNYFMAYSSFPPEKGEERKYWTRQDYADYLARFIERFDLRRRIELDTEITSVRRSAGGVFVVRGRRAGQDFTETFDAVAVCTGSHRIPHRPRFEGEETFRGTIHHSADFTSGKAFAGKRVVCIGAGETAADVVKYISDEADACWMSFRRYQGIISRYPKGRSHTNDAYSSRVHHSLPLRTLYSEWLVNIATPDHAPPGPAETFIRDWNERSGGVGQFFTKSDVFVDNVLRGKLVLKPQAIARLDGPEVVFADGSRVTADAIMCCTGYEDRFDFLEDVKIDHARQLYKHMIHPRLPGVAFLGWARPALGGIPATAEMQARYFALLLSGKRKLPPPAKLEKMTARDAAVEELMFDQQPGLKTLVHYSPFMNAMADLIGCQVKPLLLLTKPRLLYKAYFGSNIGATYRLHGPHRQPAVAEEVILRLPVAYTRSEILRNGAAAAVTALARRCMAPLLPVIAERKAAQRG